MREHERASLYPRLVAIFGTVLYFALIVCVFGFISLATDTDVSPDPGTPLIVGLAPVAVVVLATGVVLLTSSAEAIRRADARGTVTRLPIVAAVVWSLVTWLIFGVTTGVASAFATDRFLDVVLETGATLVRPYSVAAGILTGVVLISTAVVLAVSGPHPHRLLWPWERRK